MLSLIRRRPERALNERTNPLLHLRNEMEDLFHRFGEDWGFPEEWAEVREWVFEERENEVVMRLEMPGFEASEIHLTVEGNVFVLRAEHPESTEEKNAHRHMERYEYRFMLPFGTDANAIAANYRNGVLEVHLPRLPNVEPKRVEVKT